MNKNNAFLGAQFLTDLKCKTYQEIMIGEMNLQRHRIHAESISIKLVFKERKMPAERTGYRPLRVVITQAWSCGLCVPLGSEHQIN